MSQGETPIRRQYLDLKAKHAGCILFFRLGDFYETFDADAELVARELDVVLTSRPVGKDVRVPMAGVPHHAADGYIARLIERGYRVAIAEQIGSDPINGLVPREVRRVITPGTVIDPGMLDAGRPNYLVAICPGEGRAAGYGLAFCDLSTGEFRSTQLPGRHELEREIGRLLPRELVLAEGVPADDLEQAGRVITRLPAYRFELGHARQALLAHLKLSTLAALGLDDKPLAVRAAGAALAYVRETQPATLALFGSLNSYTTSAFMALDDVARRNLEITEPLRAARPGAKSIAPTLLGVLDATLSAMGARTLRAWLQQPLLDETLIDERLNRIAALHGDAMLRARMRNGLKNMPDVERLAGRVLSNFATPADLLNLKTGLMQCGVLLRELGDADGMRAIFGVPESIAPISEAIQMIGRAIKDEPDEQGFIKAGYSAELDEIHLAVRDARTWVANLERVERERTGIKTLKVGYNKVFGYYIEITHANAAAAPTDYIRKQTLTNAERYITPQLKEYETLILNADERVVELERRLLTALNSELADAAGPMLQAASVVARLDVAAALAEVAARNKYCRPTFNRDGSMQIVDGRHAVIEQLLVETPYTPNNLTLDADGRIWVITGPNMSGKSSFMRQAALIVLMAQAGSYVPAANANLPIIDRIFTRIGAQDELTAGNSTFMVEMVETANILRHCTPNSLVLLDEIGRGTSTYDGLAIAWSVIEYLHNHPDHRAFTLFATHYHELIALEATHKHVRNMNVSVSDEGGKIVFLHKVVPGGADRSYGVHVADLAGLPPSVVNRARALLRELEKAPRDPAAPSGPQPETVPQLALFSEENAAVTKLRNLDPNTLSPIEALTALFELKKMAT